MKKGFWITAGLSGLITLFAFFFFVIWRPTLIYRDAEKGNNTTVKIDQKTAGKEEVKPPESGITVSSFIQDAEIPKGLEFKPFFDEEQKKISETFLERFSALANPPIFAPESASVFFPSQSTSTKKEQSVASVPEATSTEIILSLTAEEFHFLYPDDFIASLMEAQNILIKEYDPNYEPLSKIETDSQVRFVEEKLVASLLSMGMITDEKAERSLTTIRLTLPQLQLEELKNRKSFILNQSFMSFLLLKRPPLEGSFFVGLIEKLYSVLFLKAEAKACGHCYDLPECYQVGASGLAGTNTFKIFCNCTGCLTSLGCLSSCTGKAAIWDPTTMICGC